MELRFVNGSHVPTTEGVVSSSLDLGVGHFTSFRARYLDNAFYVLGLEHHFTRLKTAAGLLSPIGVCNPRRDEIERVLQTALCTSKSTEDLRVRLSFWKDVWEVRTITCGASSVHPQISLLPFVGERSLPEVKSTSALLSVVAHNAAKNAGYGEGLLVDRAGNIRETSWGNFLWVGYEGAVHYIPSRVLPGVTQAILLEIIEERQLAPIRRQDLTISKISSEVAGALVSTSIRGPVSVCKVADKDLPTLELVNDLQEIYWHRDTWLSQYGTRFTII